jgi:uncharacterized protein (UPF0276 family)
MSPSSPGANAVAAPIPARAGIGLRHRHVVDVLRTPPDIGWVEIHSENYLSDGGPRLAALERIRRDFPLSCHGVGLSLGSAEGLDRQHLAALRRLFDRFTPGLVSEHVAWSITGGVYLNDLLPLPFTDEALAVLCRNVDQAQDSFGRQLLIENPSSYLSFTETTMPEWDFLRAIVDRTGCGLLLDVNNIHVSGFNTGFDPDRYLEGLPWAAVQEIHVAGHTIARFDAQTMLIDDHGSPVADAVWGLLRSALRRTGPLPVLVEWDTAIPELPVLLAEAAKADRLLQAVRTGRHAA